VGGIVSDWEGALESQYCCTWRATWQPVAGPDVACGPDFVHHCRIWRVKPSGDWLSREDLAQPRRQAISDAADNCGLVARSLSLAGGVRSSTRATIKRLGRTGRILPPSCSGPRRPGPGGTTDTRWRHRKTWSRRWRHRNMWWRRQGDYHASRYRMYTQPAAATTCRHSRPEMSSTVGYHVTREPPVHDRSQQPRYFTTFTEISTTSSCYTEQPQLICAFIV